MSVSTAASSFLAMLGVANDANPFDVVVEIARGGDACPHNAYYCKGFIWRVAELTANNSQAIVNQGNGAVQVERMSPHCHNANAKRVVRCIYRGLTDAFQRAFSEESGDSQVERCHAKVAPTVFECRQYQTVFKATKHMPRDICDDLNDEISEAQRQCAKYLGSFKGTAIALGVLASLFALLGCCYAVAHYKQTRGGSCCGSRDDGYAYDRL